MQTHCRTLSHKPLKISSAILSNDVELSTMSESAIELLLEAHRGPLVDGDKGLAVYVITVVKTASGSIHALATQPGTGQRRDVIGHIAQVDIGDADTVQDALMRSAEKALNEAYTVHDEHGYLGLVDLHSRYTGEVIEFRSVLIRDGVPCLCLVYNYAIPDEWSVKLTKTAKDIYRRVKLIQRDAFFRLGYPSTTSSEQ